MEPMIKTLLSNYQVRKTYQQKSEFIDWLNQYCQQNDYKLQIDKHGKCRNLIIGDVAKAQLFLTAHYDTQPNAYISIVTSIDNIGMYLISQLVSMWPIFLYLFISQWLIYNLSDYLGMLATIVVIGLLGIVIPLAFVYQISWGKANQHTANDNTSGIATLLLIMHQLKPEQRKHVCFVLFDLEEQGLVGSMKFKKKYRQYAGKSLINFDCVSDGDAYFVVSKKHFRQSNKFVHLIKSAKITKKPVLFKPATQVLYPSDQLLFKNSVGIVAVKHSRWWGHYLDRIHTKRDVIFQYENLVDLSKMILCFMALVEQDDVFDVID